MYLMRCWEICQAINCATLLFMSALFNFLALSGLNSHLQETLIHPSIDLEWFSKCLYDTVVQKVVTIIVGWNIIVAYKLASMILSWYWSDMNKRCNGEIWQTKDMEKVKHFSQSFSAIKNWKTNMLPVTYFCFSFTLFVEKDWLKS